MVMTPVLAAGMGEARGRGLYGCPAVIVATGYG